MHTSCPSGWSGSGISSANSSPPPFLPYQDNKNNNECKEVNNLWFGVRGGGGGGVVGLDLGCHTTSEYYSS